MSWGLVIRACVHVKCREILVVQRLARLKADVPFPMGLVIRDFMPADVREVLTLIDTCRTNANAPSIDLAEFIADLSDGSVVLVAEERNEIVGVVSARPSGDSAWTRTLGIAPNRRHQGVGSALLQGVEERLLHLGVRKISALLAPGELGEEALVNRGFTVTHGLVLYEKREPLEPSDVRVVDEWGGLLLEAGLWDEAAGMTREKSLIETQIVAPLLDPDLAAQIGLRPPATVMLFGPPGTGKTTFAKAIASRLGWPFVELLPSKLASGRGTLASELHRAFVELGQLEHVVIFIDEFDEIAPARDTQPATAGVVNELLKSIPEFRRRPGRLLVCATNFVGSIDPAVLRPGRFDLLIAIGPPDDAALAALWRRALAPMATSADVVAADLARATTGFTAGDVDLAGQRAAVLAFDRARSGAAPAVVTAMDLRTAISQTRPSIPVEIVERFRIEAAEFERV